MNYTLSSSFLSSCLLNSSQEALNLLEQSLKSSATLYSHNLLQLEISNLIAGQDLPEPDKEYLYSNFKLLPLTYWQLSPAEYSEIFFYANLYKCSTYEFSYHYLAKLSGSILLTTNKKYYEKTKSFGNIKLV